MQVSRPLSSADPSVHKLMTSGSLGGGGPAIGRVMWGWYGAIANFPVPLRMCMCVAMMDWGAVKARTQPNASGMSGQIRVVPWWGGGWGAAGSHRVRESQSRITDTFCLVAGPRLLLGRETRSPTEEIALEERSFQ